MAVQIHNVEFQGYWTDENNTGIPAESGVYCVYECTRSTDNDPPTVTLRRLIYIGEAENVRGRISNHERRLDWQRHARTGNELCYNFGSIGAWSRERVEAAYILRHKPPENTEYVNEFPFDRTRVRSSGRAEKLDPDFTVERTA